MNLAAANASASRSHSSTEPRLLLLDEPTQNLDIGRQVELIDLLRFLRDEGITILASMHDLHLVPDNFDAVLLLAPGEPLRSGTPSDDAAGARSGRFNVHQIVIRCFWNKGDLHEHNGQRVISASEGTYCRDRRRQTDRGARASRQSDQALGSLGRLEEIAAQLYAIRGDAMQPEMRKAVYVFAADHGITAEGVSAYPAEVTRQMVENFLAGGAAVNVLARAHGATVHVVDVGVDADLHGRANLLHHKVRRGSRNMLREGAAKVSDELAAAIAVGAALADDAASRGMELLAIGEMGMATRPLQARSPRHLRAGLWPRSLAEAQD